MTLNISQITPRISSKKLAMIAAVNILRIDLRTPLNMDVADLSTWD
jgi:hypothetical protein